MTKQAIEGASKDGEALILMECEAAYPPATPRSGRWPIYFLPNWGMMTKGGDAVARLMSISTTKTNQASGYTATTSDFVIGMTASGGSATITLPSASANKGRQYVIEKVDASANAVVVTRAGGDTIEGAATKSLTTRYHAVWIQSDGVSNWIILGERLPGITPSSFKVGKTIYVDSVYGSDATGTREDSTKPFLTIAAALAAASSGDFVHVGPGTYNITTGLTIPSGVSLYGDATNVCTIQKLLATADTTLITMGTDTQLERFTLNLTSAEHHALTLIKFGGTSNTASTIRTIKGTVNNSGATGSGTSVVTGILVQATGTPGHEVMNARSVDISVLSVGLGTKRGLLSDTSVSNFYMTDANFKASGGSDCIGVEINKASSVLHYVTGSAKGTTADTSQTAGSLEMGSVELLTPSANAKNFTAIQTSSVLTWSEAGGLVPNATRYFRIAGATSVAEIKVPVPRSGIIKALHIHAQTGPGGARTAVFTVRKNGVATTLTATLTGAATDVSDETHSFAVAKGDDLSLEVVTQVADTTSDVQVTAELY